MARARRRLTDLDDVHLQCRDLRHTWEQRSAWTERAGRTQQVHRLLRCARGCGTFRWDTYNARTMERTHVSYRYDDRYLLQGNERPPNGDEVRTEVFRRLRGDMPKEPPPEARDILDL